MKLGYALKTIMNREIVSLDAEAVLTEAMQIMVEKDIGSIVVTRGGEMTGILTERDVLKKICFDHECALMKIADVMSSPLVTIDGSVSIGEAADKMGREKIRRLLVTEEGKIVGIVTERDIMRATLDVFRKLSDAWV